MCRAFSEYEIKLPTNRCSVLSCHGSSRHFSGITFVFQKVSNICGDVGNDDDSNEGGDCNYIGDAGQQ